MLSLVITLTCDITIFHKCTNIFYIIILFISSLLRRALIKYLKNINYSYIRYIKIKIVYF